MSMKVWYVERKNDAQNRVEQEGVGPSPGTIIKLSAFHRQDRSKYHSAVLPSTDEGKIS
jgi:hypothetical protein